MSRAQAPQSRAQPQDGPPSPPSPAPAMLQLPLPVGRPQHPANHTSHYSTDDIDSASDIHNDLAYDASSNDNSSNSNNSSHGIPSDAHPLTTHHHRHHNYLNAESHVGRNSRLPTPGSLDLTTLTSGTTEEQQQRAVEEFYRSYDPQIGLHTAAVLGGILGWLIVYLLYKTKVKKWAASLVHGKQHRRQRRLSHNSSRQLGVCEVLGEQQATTASIPNHHFCPPQFQQYRQFQQVCQDPEEASHQDHLSSRQSSCSSGKPAKRSGKQCPMPSIIIESYSPPFKLSKTTVKRQQARENPTKQPSHKPRHKSKPAKRPPKKGKKYKRIGGGSCSSSRNKRCPEVTVLDADDPDTVPFLLPPCCDADSARATARWVQSMPLVMQSYQDLTGLILKVHPLMVGAQKPQSCPMISAALRYAALPVLGPPNVGWNKSLPLLTDKSGAGSLQDNELDSVFSPVDKLPVGADGKLSVLPTSPCRPPLVRPCSAHASTPSTDTSCSPCYGPPPRLTLPGSDQLQFLSAVNLSVPGAHAFPGACAVSAPASPVPLPVTPLVTIHHFASSRACRNSNSALPLQQQQRTDSQDSLSSSSSADALLHVLESGSILNPNANAFLPHSLHHIPHPRHHPPVSRSSPHISWNASSSNPCQHTGDLIPGGPEVAPKPSKQEDCCHDQTLASRVPDPIFTLETKL